VCQERCVGTESLCPTKVRRFHYDEGLVRFATVLWFLQLHLKSLNSNLEAIHCRDSSLGAAGIIKTYKPKTLALVCSSINKDLGTDDISEWKEHLHELGVTELLREMIDEEVAAVWAAYGAADAGEGEGGAVQGQGGAAHLAGLGDDAVLTVVLM